MTQHDSPEQQRLAEFLDELTAKLESDPETALQLLDRASPELTAAPEVTLTRAQLLATMGQPQKALELCQSLVADHPDDADFVYALGTIHQMLGDDTATTSQWLHAYELDGLVDPYADVDREELEDFIVDIVEEVMEDLPSPFKEDLTQVPVLIEDRPQKQMVEEGFDPRALGVFEGPSSQERSGVEVIAAPTRIVLYAANLLAISPDEDHLAEQVAVTLYHEMGHYYGLEEEDMERLGLD